MSANAAFDAVACSGAIVFVAVPATIPLLRRMHAVDVPSVRSSPSVPTSRGGALPIAVGLLAAVAITRSERWLQARRTHLYQQWCDAGWSHGEVTLLTGAVIILLTLLGTVSLTRDLPPRAGADLVGIAVLAAYLCSPALLRRLGLQGKPEPYRLAARLSLASNNTPRCQEGPADVRILLVTHYFPPETLTPQARLSALTRGPGPPTATR